MIHPLETLMAEYRTANTNEANVQYIGCSVLGLISFLRAIGFESPVNADLNEGLVNAYQYQVHKILHTTLAEVCLLDFEGFLRFIHERQLSQQDFSIMIKPDMEAAARNDFNAYEGQKLAS